MHLHGMAIDLRISDEAETYIRDSILFNYDQFDVLLLHELWGVTGIGLSKENILHIDTKPDVDIRFWDYNKDNSQYTSDNNIIEDI